MTRWPRTAAVAGMVLFSLSGCSISVVRRGEINRPLAEEIVQGLVELRGLPFASPVPMRVKTPERLRVRLQKDFDREYSPQEIAALEKIYTRLGLLPRDVKLADELIRLYESQVAGFYDPRTKKLYLVDPSPSTGGWLLALVQTILRRDLIGEMLLAHELTHALQDQHFDVLGRMSDTTDDDRALAASAVVEGDATLSGFAYVFGGLAEPSLRNLVQRLQAIPGEMATALPDAPAVLREALIFRYTEGVRFVSWAYLHEGWAGVNALLAFPPRSTEQVLWPEKYYVSQDDPTAVGLGGLEAYREGGGWRLVEENTVGELMIRVLLREFLPEDRAVWAARGWDGDRFAAWTRDAETHLFWMTTWDSIRDAKDFFLAESELLKQLHPGAGITGTDTRVSAGLPDPYRLERRGEKVLVMLGVEPKAAEPLAEKIWTETTFTTDRRVLPLDVAQAGT